MRLMLVGRQWLGETVLRLALSDGHTVGLVAAPEGDRLSDAAAAAGVAVCDPGLCLGAGVVPEGIDLIVCAHAHCFISRGARGRSRLGAIGYHPSLLPRHRGRDSVRWAIHMRDPITGGTVYLMDDRADGGPVLAQDWCFVRPDDTPATLWRRELGPLGVRLIREAIGGLADGSLASIPQDESLASWEPSFDRGSLKSRR